jgi:hypothetical protein
MTMPYSMEAGPYLSLFESFFNDDRNRAVWALGFLRELDAKEEPAHAVTDLFRRVPCETSCLTGAPAGQTTAQDLADFMDKDWFKKPATKSKAVDEVVANFKSEYTGGELWDYWYGNSEQIVRETLIRALEVSLGVDHGARPDDDPDGQHWPIGLRAVCGLRWWEGWLSWRQIGTSGYVDVIFLTPSHGYPARPVLLRSKDRPGYEVEPVKAQGKQGLWAVGALLEQKVDPPVPSDGWARQGDITMPGLGPIYIARGDPKSGRETVTVSPPEGQGGVMPQGRPYIVDTSVAGFTLPYTRSPAGAKRAPTGAPSSSRPARHTQ